MNISVASPFSEEDYDLQRRQWLAWRSRHLDYYMSDLNAYRNDIVSLEPVPIPDPICLQPSPAMTPQNRHNQLDAIKARHKTAAKHASAWSDAITSQQGASTAR